MPLTKRDLEDVRWAHAERVAPYNEGPTICHNCLDTYPCMYVRMAAAVEVLMSISEDETGCPNAKRAREVLAR